MKDSYRERLIVPEASESLMLVLLPSDVTLKKVLVTIRRRQTIQ